MKGFWKKQGQDQQLDLVVDVAVVIQVSEVVPRDRLLIGTKARTTMGLDLKLVLDKRNVQSFLL